MIASDPSVPPVLLVVVPVFNEEASISKVITEWFQELERSVGNFQILAIDDGSADRTPNILRSLQNDLGPKLEWITRENRGHGQTCIQGYRIAAERGIPFVFQIDSDGQCNPEYFSTLWKQRENYDVIYGKRTRDDGFRRKLASFVLRSSLLLLFRVNCVDANVPYRLMNTARCAPCFAAIPSSIFLANVALSVVLRRASGLRHGAVPIRFQPRYGGEPSVPFSKFASKALELFRQLAEMKPGQP